MIKAVSSATFEITEDMRGRGVNGEVLLRQFILLSPDLFSTQNVLSESYW